MAKLQSLQSITELNEFLDFIETNKSLLLNNPSELTKKINNLIDSWLNAMPNMFTDPSTTWDDVITNRCVYFDFIINNYLKNNDNQLSSHDQSSFIINSNENDEMIVSLKKKINLSKIMMNIKFAQSAQLQGNYKLALNKLFQTKIVRNNNNNININSSNENLELVWMVN